MHSAQVEAQVTYRCRAHDAEASGGHPVPETAGGPPTATPVPRARGETTHARHRDRHAGGGLIAFFLVLLVVIVHGHQVLALHLDRRFVSAFAFVWALVDGSDLLDGAFCFVPEVILRVNQ